MRKQLSLTILMMLTLVFFIAGCSDDSTNMTAGDQNDEGYLLARADADSTVNELNEDEGEDVGWLDFNLAKFVDTDTAGYDSTTGWYFIIYDDTIFFYLQVEVTDSVRFTDTDGIHQRYPDSTTSEFERRM